jgi:hypothetical protein
MTSHLICSVTPFMHFLYAVTKPLEWKVQFIGRLSCFNINLHSFPCFNLFIEASAGKLTNQVSTEKTMLDRRDIYFDICGKCFGKARN